MERKYGSISSTSASPTYAIGVDVSTIATRIAIFVLKARALYRPHPQQFDSWLRANQTGPSKKNVVRVSGFYKDRAENISTWRGREGKQFPSQAKTSKTTKQPEKDSSDMEADFAEFPNTESCDVMSQHGKSNSSLLECENMGEYFSQKIREVDKDLENHFKKSNISTV